MYPEISLHRNDKTENPHRLILMSASTPPALRQIISGTHCHPDGISFTEGFDCFRRKGKKKKKRHTLHILQKLSALEKILDNCMLRNEDLMMTSDTSALFSG